MEKVDKINLIFVGINIMSCNFHFQKQNYGFAAFAGLLGIFLFLISWNSDKK